MTNPGNAVGTNGAYGGRTSVNAFNDVLSAFDGPGIIAGWQCVPKAGLTVSLGGSALQRDVAIAQNDIGQRTTANNISTQPVDVTLAAAPTAGQRIDAIVAYVNNPPESNSDEIDNPDACGLITVSSSVTTNPTVPTESMIRDAITADGASGATAYYVVLATINVQTGASVITQNDIMAGKKAVVTNLEIADKSITGDKIADNTITSSNIDFETIDLVQEHVIGNINGAKIYEKTVQGVVTYSNSTGYLLHNISNLGRVISATGTVVLYTGNDYILGSHSYTNNVGSGIWTIDSTQIELQRATGFTAVQERPHTITLRYLKLAQ